MPLLRPLLQGQDGGRAVVISGLPWEGSGSSSRGWSQDSVFLKGCQSEVILISLHAGLSNTAACFIKAHKPKSQERASESKMEVTVFVT